MAHAHARLTEFGRLLLVQRITELGWPPAQAAQALGVSRATASKWLARDRTHGPAGLADRSSRPHRCPPALPVSQVRRVLAARRRHRQGPHRLAWRLGMPRSTIYGVLARHGMGRLAHTDRASGVVVRYQREHPGERVHLDVKKLGRIPDGGGHRVHGRTPTTPTGRGIGYDSVHSAVDDRSRVAFSQVLPDESAMTAALFLIEAAGFFADHGVQIQRVLADNAKAYAESVVFAETAAGLGIALRRTRRYRPQTNGKVERFNKTLLEEWAYARLYRSNRERRRALRRWLRFYNRRRPHTALDGLTPMAVLDNNVHGNHT
ncbi:MAG: IS481 family transposase [Actinomycetes bacterium]